jgi:putative hydrolase of the HAD superfamily
VSELVGSPKPYPLIFKYALFKLNLKPKEIIYVGDRLDNDIAGAKNLGIPAVLLVRNQKNAPTEIPQSLKVIHSLRDLHKAIISSYQEIDAHDE